jgi:hypothetical protein
MNAPLTIQEVQRSGGAVALQQAVDQAVDMFTERGFTLANRIAKAYASSDAVPAQFRSQNLKKSGREEHWVENPSAIGNCLVAIEVARAVRMSITAVMQNADMIEGKLRWSGKFVIAAINASGRFTPLRFQMVDHGKIKATYKEKTGWDREANRPVFVERTVEVDNVECIAWALPKGIPEPQITPDMLRKHPGRMLDLYKALGMPVIESAPVTMRMVVEEGWYGKSGSKWQTEMRTLMFQYRAGSFFGNIHAPDIVMGMGATSEEARDIQVVDVDPHSGVATVTTESLRADMRRVEAEVVQESATVGAKVDPSTGEIQNARAPKPEVDMDAFAERLEKCADLDVLDLAADEIRDMPADDQVMLREVYQRRRQELVDKAAQPAQQRQAAPTRRRTMSSME